MFTKIYLERRAHCPASMQAAAKDVHEKISGENTLLALRATGGGLWLTSAFSSYYYFFNFLNFKTC